MFCPSCKAEYRSGFTSCADCHVDLVEKLPEENSPASFIVLWRGEDANFHRALIEELERASIRFADIPLEVYLRGSSDLFRLKLGPQFGFVVSVTVSDQRAARIILDKLLERKPENVPPVPEDASAESVSRDAPDPPLHWNPELATLEIWTGNDLKRIRFLQASLSENGIPSRISEEDPKKPCLLICPEDAARVREIVREIAEAAQSETPAPRSTEYIWYDEPVRSYLFAWLPGVIYAGIVILVYALAAGPGEFLTAHSPLDPVFSLVKFVDEIASLWMIYQAIRYEIHPLRFVLLSGLPLSFIWYYYERYSRRTGRQRLPIAVRMRMSPPPTA
jgi:hypothetical protein